MILSHSPVQRQSLCVKRFVCAKWGWCSPARSTTSIYHIHLPHTVDTRSRRRDNPPHRDTPSEAAVSLRTMVTPVAWLSFRTEFYCIQYTTRTEFSLQEIQQSFTLNRAVLYRRVFGCIEECLAVSRTELYCIEECLAVSPTEFPCTQKRDRASRGRHHLLYICSTVHRIQQIIYCICGIVLHMCTHKLIMYMLYTYILYKYSRSSQVHEIMSHTVQEVGGFANRTYTVHDLLQIHVQQICMYSRSCTVYVLLSDTSAHINST